MGGGRGSSSSWSSSFPACRDADDPPPFPPSRSSRHLHVHTLDKLNLNLVVKCRVVDVFAHCCQRLAITDGRVLGLALRAPAEGISTDTPRHEYFFLAPDQRLHKYASKAWKADTSFGSNPENRPLFALYLRVRIYVDHVRLITCEIALRHYYLQLRENLLDHWAGISSVSEERCWEIAALAIQADRVDITAIDAFRAEQYFPLWLISLRGLDFVRRNLPVVLADVKPVSSREAIARFCQEASRPPFALNNHLYGLRRHKVDTEDTALLCIAPRGIEMWTQGDHRISLRCIPWSRISRLAFDHRRISLEAVDGFRLRLYAESDTKARYLFEFCRAVHQQLLAMQEDVQRIMQTRESEDLAILETAISPTGIPNTQQRRSIASDVSSNSTSGIVSDRHHSDAERDFDGESSGRGQSIVHGIGGISSMGSSSELLSLSACESIALPETIALNEEHTGSEEGGVNPIPAVIAANRVDARAYRRDRRKRGESAPRIAPLVPTRHETFARARSDSEASTTQVFRIVSAQKTQTPRSRNAIATVDPGRGVQSPLHSQVASHSVFPNPGFSMYSDPSTPLVLVRPGPVGDSRAPTRPRWTTVAGIEAAVMAELEQRQLLLQRGHLARSESRLHEQVGNGNVNFPMAYLSPQPRLEVSRRPSPEPTEGVSSRGINRVQSMPAHSSMHHAVYAGHMPSVLRGADRRPDSTSGGRTLQHAQSLLEHGARQPPSYERALQLQQARAVAVQRNREMQRSTNSIGDEQQALVRHINEFPMMRALWQESHATDTRLIPPLAFADPSTHMSNGHIVASSGRPVMDLPPPPPYPQAKLSTASAPGARALVM